VKPYSKRENETNDDVPPVETTKENETDDVSQENVPQDLRKCKRTPVNDSPVQSSRPGVRRRCLPKKFDDFVAPAGFNSFESYFSKQSHH